MPVMNDVPNDIWAVGVVLFELVMSAEAVWKDKQGPFMFGPRPKDLKACTNGSSHEQTSSLRMAVQREQSCWVRSVQQCVSACTDAPASLGDMEVATPHAVPSTVCLWKTSWKTLHHLCAYTRNEHRFQS